MSRQQEKDEQHVPLTGRYEESVEDNHSMLSDDTLAAAAPARRQRRRWIESPCCLAILFIMTSLVSLFLGAILAFSTLNMDKECALHTTQYCELT